MLGTITNKCTKRIILKKTTNQLLSQKFPSSCFNARITEIIKIENEWTRSTLINWPQNFRIGPVNVNIAQFLDSPEHFYCFTRHDRRSRTRRQYNRNAATSRGLARPHPPSPAWDPRARWHSNKDSPPGTVVPPWRIRWNFSSSVVGPVSVSCRSVPARRSPLSRTWGRGWFVRRFGGLSTGR